MPLVQQDNQQAMPAWCELESYDVITVPPGQEIELPRRGAVEKLIVVTGGAKLAAPEARTLAARDIADLTAADPAARFRLRDAEPGTVVVHLAGRWGSETGGAGVFTVNRVDQPTDKGDPVWYPKETTIDRHYHDCDEYWIVVKGRGVAMSEGTLYPMGPGDCLAIGMGHHHDFPQVSEPVRAVYFETTLEGQKRRGHLWEHTHGPAAPRHDRV